MTNYPLWFNLLHPLATLIAAGTGYLLGYPLMFSVAAMWFFIGRELAQAEYKWIERFGDGKRANMPFFAPLEPRIWDSHSFFYNLLLPIIITGIIYAYC